MPRKAFIADLQEATRFHGVDCVHDLTPGDDDGQFRFLFAHNELERPIMVTAGVTELSDYPSQHDYFIFAADDTAPHAAKVLSTKLPSTRAKTVTQLLSLVSNALLKYVVSQCDMSMPDLQVDDEDLESEADFDYDSNGDEDFGVGFNPPSGDNDDFPSHDPHNETTLSFRNRVRTDLRTAKDAGFKVGHLREILHGHSCYVSVSVRIAKLGISESAMQAWQVAPSEYLILLIHYPSYKTLEELVARDSFHTRSSAPSMRVGVSKRYKPTIDEALSAFAVADSHRSTKSSSDNRTMQDNDSFRPTFISKSLENLLNERLISMLKYREIGMSRLGAEQFYIDNLAGASVASGSVDDKYFVSQEPNATYPKLVNADHWTSTNPTGLSFPLLAMQALLRHFVRCTEFCVVCHRKLDEEIEAIKPYVCEQGLCLFQYITMGFGPSFEHEILSQPYTVDLLISFAYTQTACGRLNDFPHGLGMKIPKSLDTRIASMSGRHQYSTETVPPRTTDLSANMLEVKFDRRRREVLFTAANAQCPLRVGDWIVVTRENAQDEGQLHCRVMEVCYPTVKVGPLICPLVANTSMDTGSPDGGSASTSDVNLPVHWEPASLEKYDIEFDTLGADSKRGVIKNLLDCLPSIPEMRAYLTKDRSQDLAKWVGRMPPACLSLLRWIIASNRACIMQVYDEDPVSGKPQAKEDRVSGMQDWMQFRIAMGAPDKERRFIKCVRQTETRLKLTHPTIFAFHGSALQNWHSIIREGLHYNDTINGRAFGHGVYHSLDLNTSLGYSGMYGMSPRMSWPRSVLQINTALALNEIVNATEEFTSSNPHLVVQHVDWIQTRYLFVKCTGDAFINFDEGKPKKERPQDPTMTPRAGHGRPLVIPACAASTGKRRISSLKTGQPAKNKKNTKGKSKGASNDPVIIDEEEEIRFGDDGMSDITDIEDLEILFHEDPPVVADIAKPPPLLQTDFVPGKLDHTKLPKLPMPEYANTLATTRLNKDFTFLLKVQNTTPLHELGWYIDPEKFDCPYQWIVELHSFHTFEENHRDIPLVDDMKKVGLKSIVLEMRFPGSYPNTPPFVRIIEPRFLAFMNGGGGHVTAGGALCMELLTNSGWSPVSSIESVLLQVRLAIASMDPKPARLESTNKHQQRPYDIIEAVEAYKRACRAHGWEIPKDFDQMAY